MHRRTTHTLALLIVVPALVAACATRDEPESVPATELPAATEEPAADEHMEDEHMDEVDMHSPEEHMEGEHDVPDEAAAVPNPLREDGDSTLLGGELYAANCALCHGETGEGDGPAASGIQPPPADLHADHVQALSDGALFYIITHGRPDTPMPAWENQLSEIERWQVVNYLRTFGDG